MFGKNPGQFRQDANERKVKDALNAESSPPVIPFYRLCRCVLCPAHQRHFFIRFPDKVKLAAMSMSDASATLQTVSLYSIFFSSISLPPLVYNQ